MDPRKRLIILTILIVGGLVGGRILLFQTLTRDPETLSTDLQQELETEGEQPDAEGVPSDTEDTLPDAKNEQSLPPETTDGLMTAPQQQPTTTVQVLLPPRYNKTAQSELAATIKKYASTPIETIFYQATTYAGYLRMIETMSKGARQADIMLIPRSERELVTGRSAKVQRNNIPSGLFHPQVANLMHDVGLSFIPYAIDPRLTIRKEAPTDRSAARQLGYMLQYIATKKTRIPVSSTETAAPRWKKLMSIRLDQTVTIQNEETLRALITPLSSLSGQRVCLDELDCLRTSPTLSLLWLPLSALEAYTPEQITETIDIFPTLTTAAPTEVRGRVIRDASTSSSATVGWIKAYFQSMEADALPYHYRLLPAHHQRLTRLLLQSHLSFFDTMIYKLDILDIGTKSITKRFGEFDIEGLLTGMVRPASFLSSRQKKDQQ